MEVRVLSPALLAALCATSFAGTGVAQTSQPGLVARATATSVRVYASPAADAPKFVLRSPNKLGTRLTFLVRERQGSWLRVLVPRRPNGATGWIRASSVRVASIRVHAVVVLRERRVTVFRDDVPIARFVVGIGAPRTPTPTGEFFVTDSLPMAGRYGGSFGPWALGLSGFSNVIKQFLGGPGQIAIHGTNEPRSVGRAATFGCLRARNADMLRLRALLPLGTPVTIVPSR